MGRLSSGQPPLPPGPNLPKQSPPLQLPDTIDTITPLYATPLHPRPQPPPPLLGTVSSPCSSPTHLWTGQVGWSPHWESPVGTRSLSLRRDSGIWDLNLQCTQAPGTTPAPSSAARFGHLRSPCKPWSPAPPPSCISLIGAPQPRSPQSLDSFLTLAAGVLPANWAGGGSGKRGLPCSFCPVGQGFP